MTSRADYGSPTSPTVVSKLRPILAAFLICCLLLCDVAVTPVNSCQRTVNTPDTTTTTAGTTTVTATSTSTSKTTTTTAVVCPCPTLSTIYVTVPETPAGTPTSIADGTVGFPSTPVDTNNCAESVTCTVQKGFVPRFLFSGGGGGNRNTFGPINQPLVQDVTCNTATKVWMRDGVPAGQAPFTQFTCISFGLACPCPKLSELELTNVQNNRMNVPLTGKIAITLNPVTDCEASAMINCDAFGTGKPPRLELRTPRDVTVGQVAGTVSKTATCRNNGVWRTRDSNNANFDFTGYRCFYRTGNNG